MRVRFDDKTDTVVITMSPSDARYLESEMLNEDSGGEKSQTISTRFYFELKRLRIDTNEFGRGHNMKKKR